MHNELVLIISISSTVYSWYTSSSISLTTLLLLLWQTFLKCPTLLQSTHILLYTGHCLGWWIPLQYMHGCQCVVQCTGAIILSSFAFFDILILSNCFDSVNVFNTVAWALCTSPLLAHAYTPLLVMWSSFLVAVSSFIISSDIYLLFKP